MTQFDAPPHRIQEFIFVRELSEVYLLLDHVSGRWDKDLFGGSKGDKPDLGTTWIEDICEIGWPPAGGAVERAKQAALLLLAKDRLNAAAKPATGMTVAFTLLVAGEATRAARARRGWVARLRRSWQQWAGEAPVGNGPPQAPATTAGRDTVPSPPAMATAFGGSPDSTPSRNSLACTAYPGLVETARWFKMEIKLILALLFVWLGFTCALSWHVAIGHSIMSRVDEIHQRQRALNDKIAAAEAQAVRADGSKPQAAAGTAANATLPRPSRLCPPATAAPAREFASLDQMQLCDERVALSAELAAIHEGLGDWLAWWDWCRSPSRLLPAWAGGAPVGAAVQQPSPTAAEQRGALLTDLLTAAVLPFCYGFLGAGAAVVRDLWNKMRGSLLAPRDLTLALGQLALGAVIGACIGLFIAPSGPAAHGGTGAQVALTASALSFIAGFGVEGVFVMLESLIRRVFNTADTGKPP